MAVHLFLASPRRVSETEFSWIRLETLGKKFEHQSLETIGDEKKPAFGRPFSSGKKFSKTRIACLSWKESTFHLPNAKASGGQSGLPRLLGQERTIYAIHSCSSATTKRSAVIPISESDSDAGLLIGAKQLL